MGNVFFNWILLGITMAMTRSLRIEDSKSGSKRCNLTLRFNPSPVFFTGYQSLEIFKDPDISSEYFPLHCRVHSVKIIREFQGKLPLKGKIFTRMAIKKQNTKLEVILQHRDFKPFPVEGSFVHVELECNGRRCSLLSSDTFKKKISPSFWKPQSRKLFGLRTKGETDNLDIPPVLVAVIGIIVLIFALALCACGNTSHEKALGDEVGGVEVDHHVVPVSTVQLEDGQNVTERVTPVKKENDSSSNGRRNTNESKKSERISQSAKESGEVNVTGRTASQSSQPEKCFIGEVESRPRSSCSRNSVDKIEETPLGSSVPKKGTEKVTPERKRTGSDKEAKNTEKGSKENISSGEDRARTDSSETTKKKQPKPSRKRLESDGKEPKSSPEENTEHKTKFWQRRKSSKTKANIENNENISPKKSEKKKKIQKNKTPEHVPSPSRPGNLPLPPRPSSADDEETQYEVVETRAQRPKSNLEDADYETITTSKTRTYDKMNVLPKDHSRPASELYECINDQDAKMKRVSSESNQYDVVETRSPPKKPPPAGLEYAYTVVASQDKPLVPTETSAGSGLYEAVTDEIKQQSGVLDTQKSDIVVEDADYAVVQKDPSKKYPSKKEEDERYTKAEKQKQKSLSGDIHSAPAPPPVWSLIHVSASVRRRTQSEEEELNVERAESPSDLASLRPKTMTDMEETYAKVNLAAKKRHSVEAAAPSHEFAAASVLPERLNNESDTPPPIPPSLYADLESMKNQYEKANETSPLPSTTSTQPQANPKENAYEEVTTKVEIRSITSRPIINKVKITQGKEIVDNEKVSSKSREDPNGVLKRLKPPLGSPRNSDGRLSAGSLEGDKRYSTGLQHTYDEVLTKSSKTSQRNKDSSSGHYESEAKRNSAEYEGVNNGQKETASSSQTDSSILTFV